MNCGRRNTDLPLCLHCQCSVYYAVYLISLTFQVLLPVLIKLTMSEVISSEAYLDTHISIVHQRSSSSYSFIIQIPRTSHPALSFREVKLNCLSVVCLILPIGNSSVVVTGHIPLASSGQLPWPCSLPASCTPACWQSMGN